MALDKHVLSETALRLLPLAEGYAAKRSAVLSKELGSGGSASVFLLQRESTQTALKVYDPSFLDDKNGPAERRRIELQRRLIGNDGCLSLCADHQQSEINSLNRRACDWARGGF